MNGPASMYKTQQIVNHNGPIKLPDCMYEMKIINDNNVHQNDAVSPGHRSAIQDPKIRRNAISDQVKQFLKNNHNRYLPDLQQLDKRQCAILKHLLVLKDQVTSIKKNLNLLSNDGPEIPQSASPRDLPDIIINASPSHPPYSLELVQVIWKPSTFLSVRTYIHSSVAHLPEAASTLSKKLENFKASKATSRLNVTLIWKEIGVDTELLVSFVPIRGEVNLLRFLARCNPKALNYESSQNPHETDAILDVIHTLVHATTKKERSECFHQLNQALGGKEWLRGLTRGVADVAAYSAIRQVVGLSSSELSDDLNKFLARCARS